jgi:putative endonuclease
LSSKETRQLGIAGENLVAEWYRKKGCQILARNYTVFWKKKIGEIDIIARTGRRLIMVEVKTRTSENFMPLEETVNFRKQSYLRRMAKLYVQQNPDHQDYDLQIDVAALLMDPFDNSVKSAKLIENAIEDV